MCFYYIKKEEVLYKSLESLEITLLDARFKDLLEGSPKLFTHIVLKKRDWEDGINRVLWVSLESIGNAYVVITASYYLPLWNLSFLITQSFKALHRYKAAFYIPK